MGTTLLEQMADFLIWYAKDKLQVKYNQLYIEKNAETSFTLLDPYLFR